MPQVVTRIACSITPVDALLFALPFLIKRGEDAYYFKIKLKVEINIKIRAKVGIKIDAEFNVIIYDVIYWAAS
jgi:hypothetical protein